MTQELKNTHTEQMTRLHFKHQTECDLLEDMRYVHICVAEMIHPYIAYIHTKKKKKRINEEWRELRK